MPKNVLILGASSDMALAICRKFASQGYSLTLAGRDPDRLKPTQSDLMIRYGIEVSIVYFDALDTGSHYKFYSHLQTKPDIVICVFGFLGDQKKAESQWEECAEIIFSNYMGAVSILHVIANEMEARGSGVIAGVSSVAGERGRQSNYVYGSAKAGFTAFLSGLRNRLWKSGVHVVTVKPGFVKTRMIENIKTPSLLTAETKEVANDIYDAIVRKRNVIYTKWLWRWIMLVIRNIPEPLFKKLKL